MSSFFEKLGGALGRALGPTARQGVWVWKSVFGSEEEMLAAEADVGRNLAHALSADLPLDTDPAVQELASSLGARLVPFVNNNKRRYAFRVVAGDAPNAFALPGGYIFVTRSLVDLVAGDADQLAFILGHEMGHVIRRHPIERVMTDATIKTAIRALPPARVAGGLVRTAAGRLLQGAYSRDRELDADRTGAALAVAAGFDPTAATRMFERLASVSSQAGTIAEYFSTHPPFPERIAAVQQFLAQRDSRST